MKKIELKNDKSIIRIIILIFVSILFFSYNLIITWDSSEYFGMSRLIGSKQMAEKWMGHRGIAFPLLLRLFEPFNIYSKALILLLLFLFYIGMICILFTFYEKFAENNILNNKKDKTIFIIYNLIFIIFNPIIFGYYHAVLTEFIAITTVLFICYLSWNWTDILWDKNKKQFILYGLIFSVLITFIYHIKQSFVIGCITPIIISTTISIISNFNLKNILSKIITLFFIGIVLFCSISIWNNLMQTEGLDVSTATANARVKGKIISGISTLKRVCDNYNFSKENFNINKLDGKDIEKINKILNNKSKYNKFTIFKNYNDKYLVYYSKSDYNLQEDIIFYLKVFLNNPIDILKSYYKNYKHIIFFNSSGKLYQYNENSIIPIMIFRKGSNNLIHLNPDYAQYIKDYTRINRPNFIASVFNLYVNVIILYFIVIFTKICLWILPIVMLLFLIYSFITKNYKKSKEIELINILNITGFFGIMSYVAFGALVDRYTVFIMIPVFLSYFLIINHFLKIFKQKICSKNIKYIED